MYEINGPDADITMDMVEHMTRYLSGPGFPGFMAWVDQEYAGKTCGVGGDHVPSAMATRVNLDRLGNAIRKQQS